MFLQRPGGGSPDNSARPDNLRRQYTTARSKDCARFDTSFITNSDLPSDDSVIADHNSTGEAGLCGYDDMTSNPAVMSDVDHVVELGTVPDTGYSQSGSVYAGICSDLHVTTQSDAADLRELLV